jgi:hypothetical protein
MEVIERLDKPTVAQVFDACSRALKPGGRQFPGTVGTGIPLTLPVLYGDFTCKSCFFQQILLSLMASAGCLVIQVRKIGGSGSGVLMRVMIASRLNVVHA